MIYFDYIMSRPLSEQEQKEAENLLKTKIPEKKYEILSYEIKNLSNLAKDLELRKQELLELKEKGKGEVDENL